MRLFLILIDKPTITQMDNLDAKISHDVLTDTDIEQLYVGSLNTFNKGFFIIH